MNSTDTSGQESLAPVMPLPSSRPAMPRQTKILIGVSVLLGLLLIGAIICIVVVSNKLKDAQSKAKNDIAAYDTKYKGVVSSDSECKKNLVACNNSYSSIVKAKGVVDSELKDYKSKNDAAKVSMMLGIYKFTDQPDIYILFDTNKVKLCSIRATDDGKLTATTLGTSDVIYKTYENVPVTSGMHLMHIAFKNKIDTSAFNDQNILNEGTREFAYYHRNGSLAVSSIGYKSLMYKNNNLTKQYFDKTNLIIN